MKNLFIVTHTQSEHHVRNEVGGWHDTELSGKGGEDALRLVARLKTMIHHCDVEIFTSDLMRAVETAAPIAGAFNQHEVEMEALREISYGIAEGKPQAWLDSRIIPAPDENRMDHICIEGAETRRQFATRLFGALEDIIARPCETQIIVTHGFAVTFLVAAWIKMPLDAVGYMDLRVKPGSITHLQEDPFWKSRTVLGLGDTAHFKSRWQAKP